MAILRDFPHKIKGFVVTDGFESSTVLNSHCSYEQSLNTFEHEQSHIEDEDAFREDMTADEIEGMKHGK